MTHDELEDLVKSITAANSMLLASILRALMNNGSLTEADLSAALQQTETAALQRRTSETPTLTGIIDLLRHDLGLDAKTRHDPI